MKDLAPIETALPATQDDLISYGRNCLRVGKIATEQFGHACQALLDGEGSWTQTRVAEAMGCARSTVQEALKAAGFLMITNRRESAVVDHEPDPAAEVVEGEIVDEPEAPEPESCPAVPFTRVLGNFRIFRDQLLNYDWEPRDYERALTELRKITRALERKMK